MTGSVARVFNALHGYVYGRWTRNYIRVLLDYIFPNIRHEEKSGGLTIFTSRCLLRREQKPSST